MLLNEVKNNFNTLVYICVYYLCIRNYENSLKTRYEINKIQKISFWSNFTEKERLLSVYKFDIQFRKWWNNRQEMSNSLDALYITPYNSCGEYHSGNVIRDCKQLQEAINHWATGNLVYIHTLVPQFCCIEPHACCRCASAVTWRVHLLCTTGLHITAACSNAAFFNQHSAKLFLQFQSCT